MQDWKKKIVKQAIADGEGIVTLHFGKHLVFDIDGEKNQTDRYGDWEFQLESFFVSETLRFLDCEGVTVGEVIAKADKFLREHSVSWDEKYGVAAYQKHRTMDNF
jgi:hypothetical protein